MSLDAGTYSVTVSLPSMSFERATYTRGNEFWSNNEVNPIRGTSDVTLSAGSGNSKTSKAETIPAYTKGGSSTQSISKIEPNAYEVTLQSAGNLEVPISLTVMPVGYRAERYFDSNNCYDIYFVPRLISNTTLSVSAQEITSSTTATVTAPSGTFYPGQTIPITVQFGFPMQISSGMSLTVNGQKLTPVETGTTAYYATFLYTVKDVDNGTLNMTANSLAGTGANGQSISMSKVTNSITTNTKLQTPDKEKAFKSFNVEVKLDDAQKPYLVVTIAADRSNNGAFIKWAESELASNKNVLNSLQVSTISGKFPLEADNDQQLDNLVAKVPLDYNTTGAAITGQIEFLLDGKVLMGKNLSYTVQPSIPVVASDMSPTFNAKTAQGTMTYRSGDTVPLLYAEQDNELTLSFGLGGGKNYTWGDTSKVSYYDADGEVVLLAGDVVPHFAWKSSDTSIATVLVDDTGKAVVVPTGQEGTVKISLVALNGGPDGTDAPGMDDAETDSIEIPFAVGQDPFLIIPSAGKTIAIRENQAATINWTSNLCQKNSEHNFVPTTFHVKAVYGDESNPMIFFTTDLTTTEAGEVISSVTIPWVELKKAYNADARSITVTVSTEYLGVTYQDTATVTMTSLPAVITLGDMNLYQTDGGSGKTIEIKWDILHFDTVTEGAGFELYVARSNKNFNNGQPLSITGESIGKDGSYSITVPAVKLTSDPTSYRDIYTISVKAKNAAESTWSYSSYVMYVYSDKALRLLLDGADAGDSHTMSNVDKIAGLWGDGGETGSEAIVVLKRDIALRNVVSINYGDYAWAELADQIAWKSSDSTVATVNYQQGTLYEDIEHFSYTSYRPVTDFVLSGLSDGKTTISATHVRTGISDSVTVNVETLRDKLYLFQCYPKTETTLIYTVYTDAKHTKTEQMTLATNSNGEAAIYAPYGIAGDVYCQSETKEDGDTITWLGTIYNKNLTSSEADSTKLQLYPVNTLQLRRAAYAEIYLKKPDGTPFTGTVTFRGGVYRQGEYCDDGVLFGLQSAKPAVGSAKSGEVDQIAQVGKDGGLQVMMDLSQFTTENYEGDIQAGEKLYYLFQLEMEGYYPVFLRVDANLNTADVAATGDSIVALTKTDKGEIPFIAAQTLKYSNTPTASVGDIRNVTSYVGPSTTFPEAWITTTVMWWGDPDAESEGRTNTVTLRDTTGIVPTSQTSKVVSYPFSDYVFTENVLTLNKSTMNSWGVPLYQSKSMEVVLSKDGTANDRTLAIPYRIVNMIGAQKVEESKVLPETMGEIGTNLNVDASGGMSTGNALVQAGMKLIAGDSKYDSSQDTFAVRLFATSDPTVFRAFFCLNVGNMGSGGNVTGVYPDYTNKEDMAFVDTSGKSDLDWAPSVVNVAKMVKGTYMDSVDKDYNAAKNNEKVRNIHFDIGGYFEADICYNAQAGKWECRPVSGGFHAGGGASYSWFVNTSVGPVPVNISMTLGATLEISMDMQRGNYYTVMGGRDAVLAEVSSAAELDKLAASGDVRFTAETGNDYLTSLRIFLYIRTFAGVGFDYSVVAFKIGVFGQLNVDLNFEWLNRNYLKNANNISAVGPLDSRTDSVMAGQDPRFSGSTGIEFVFKFLFISYEKVFCSIGFELDGQFGDAETIDEIWAANKKINNKGIQQLTMPNGQVLYAVDLGAQLESRDYVDLAVQQWASGSATIALDPDQNATLAKTLQSGAYSYANPVVSDDGNLMFYLSDRIPGDVGSAMDVTNTRVAYSVRSGASFPEGTRVNAQDSIDVGYGDSAVTVAGTKDFAVAAWVRQMENIVQEGKEAGDSLTEGEQILQFNSTEIVVGLYDGKKLTLHRLTDNSSPDMAPVVATNGSYALVAWRELGSSSAEDLTSFDQNDAIRYAVYNKTTGEWSATQTLYDAAESNNAVKGLEAAMLDDGTAAVTYILDTNRTNNLNTDWETVVAIIPAENSSEDDSTNHNENTVRTFQLTTDSNLDENPKIAAVEFDGTQRFLVAWHTERVVTETGTAGTESDIRLAALDKDGVLYEQMPESLGRATEGTGAAISSNFRFAKNAENIDDLAILWVDSILPDAVDNEVGLAEALTTGVGHDVLRAVKFVQDGTSYTVSGAVDVAEMGTDTLIDAFDAYMDNGKVKSVLLGTNYSKTTQKSVVVSDGSGNDKQVGMTVPVPVSGMYTATAEFNNQFDLPAVMLNYQELYPNSDIDVQFTVRNNGKDALTGLTITNSDGVVVYSTEKDSLYADGKLNMMPNRDITVSARFPTGTTIKNTGYTITATFSDGPVTYSDTLYLDIPDVGVSSLSVVREEEGERELRYSLYNGLSAKLADEDGKWRVRVGFYADQGCTIPLTDIITVDDSDELALIDAGGYSDVVTFNVGNYVKGDGEAQEIPEAGVPVYVKAWIETKDGEAGTEYGTVLEYLDYNNNAAVTLDNLAVRRNENVTIQSTLDNSGDGSSVTVDLQYNKLTGTESGNVIVTLLDADGNILEQKQIYTGTGANNGLITLNGEERKSLEFQFTQKGASVQVSFTDAILDEKNAELESLSSSNIPGLTLNDFTEEPEGSGKYSATVTVDRSLSNIGIMFQPKSVSAEVIVELDGKVIDAEDFIYGRNLEFAAGRTHTVTITVTDGDEVRTYTLTIRPTPAPTSRNTITVEDTEHGTVTTDRNGPTANGVKVTITATPDEGYEVKRVVVTRSDGREVEITDNGDGTYTFTMPADKVTVTVTFSRIPEEVCDGGPDCPSRAFTDLDTNKWYHQYVDYVLTHGMMEGCGHGLFAPGESLSRAMLAQILYNLAGRPTVIGSSPFTDVAAGAWYADAVTWAAANEIVEGCGDGTFRPAVPVTREQLAVMLYRYEQRSGGFTGDWIFQLNFTDADQVADWAYEAMCWSVMNGIVEGKGNDNSILDPKGQASRAEAATMLMRFCENTAALQKTEP